MSDIAGKDAGGNKENDKDRAPSIDARDLTSFEIAPDGNRFKLHFTNENGTAASLALPTESLKSLILTLPTILDRALKLQHRDNSLRLVYPLGTCTIERTVGMDQYILTLGTDDGFSVSFAVTETTINNLADAVATDITLMETEERPILN